MDKELVTTCYKIPKRLRIRVKVEAAEQDKLQQEIVAEALEQYFRLAC
jgi:hypothetical protein